MLWTAGPRRVVSTLFMVDYDAFIRDIKTNKTIRVSLKSDGTEADPANNQDNKTPVISADGRFVAFTADQYGAFTPGDKNNQFDVYVHNMSNGQTRRVSVKSSGYEAKGASGSGSERPSPSRPTARASP